MRWYCVLCFAASRLKKSTLRLLSASVTFTPSSRKTSSSGGGRKSGTTLIFPRGSSVYLIFALIDAFALSPIAGSKYANDARSICEADRHDRSADLAKAEEPCLGFAVPQVFGYHAAGIRERQLGLSEADTVL